MSRNLTKALALGATLGIAGAAFGQDSLGSYDNPVNGGEEFASFEGIVELTFSGDSDGDDVATSIAIFSIPGDGSTVPTVASPVQVDDGSGTGNNIIDTNQDGTFGDAFTDADTDGININLANALTNSPQLMADLMAAQSAAGSSGAVGIQIIFSTASDPDVSTTNPTSFDGTSFNMAATSPRLLTGDLTITNAFFDADNNELILEFPVSMAPTGPNGTVVANVDENDIEIDTDDNMFDMSTTDTPSALTGNPTIGGSDNQTITFSFDDTVMTPDIPEVMEFVRAVGTDIEDFTGRVANADTDGAQIAALVEFAVNSVNWLETVDPNSGNVTDALAVEFTLPVDSTDPGDEAFYRMMFEGETFAAATDLVDEGNNDAFRLSNIAVDTTIDSTGATVVMDVDSNSNDLGVAANGRNADDDTAGDIGDEDADADGDESQNVFQLVTEVDTGNRPTSTLGTDYLGGTMGESETTTIGDSINPTFTAVSFHDLDGDGVLDAIAAIADEPLADTSSNGGVTIQALDAAMVQPFANIDMTTGALPDPIELEFAMDNDIEITTFDTSVGSVDPDLSADGVSALETNNAVIFSNLDLSGIGSDLPGTGDADVFDFAYDAMSGDYEDANGNAVDTLAATNADEDRAAPVLAMAFHQDSENIPRANLNSSNVQCFSETFDGGSPGSDDVGQDLDDRAIFVFSEDMGTTPSTSEADNITVDGTLLANADTVFDDDAVLTTPDFSNVITVIDETLDGMAGADFTIPATADFDDPTGNNFVGSGTLADNTDPYLPLQMDVNAGVGWAAFLVDDDATGETGAGFADSILLFMNGAIDSTLLDDAMEQTDNAADFTFTGFSFTPDSVMQDSGNPNILTLDVSSNDGNISMTSAQNITYNGSSASTLLTGDAKDADFEAEQPATPNTETETPFVMAINGTIMIDGSPAPVGTQICGMIAVPTVRSITAEKDGLTFRYDRADLEQEFVQETEGGDNVIERSLEDFTNYILGLEERMYLLCDSGNVDLFSNTKFYTDQGGGAPQDFPQSSSISSVGLSVNASRLDRVSFSGQTGDIRVRNGSLQLCYDVLRSDNGTLEDLIDEGFDINGNPIVSKAVVTGTDGSYSLYVSLPNLEASDSDDGIGNDPNVFATQSLPVIILVETPGGEVFPASSLTNNINGGGPILFSAEALSQNSDGSASGSLQFNIDTANVGFHSVYRGYNMVPFDRNSGFAESSQATPVLPDGVNEDNVVVGDGLLPSAGPEDQFVWWSESDDDGVFEGGEINNIVVDNDCIVGFPFVLSSEGVQFGTRGIEALVGGQSFGFGNFVGSTLGVAQFGAAISEAGIYTSNTFPNNNTTRGWASVTVTTDYDDIADFFTANPDIDFAINFDRSSDSQVDVNSASPAGGPNSANDLTSVEAGDTLIVHYAN